MHRTETPSARKTVTGGRLSPMRSGAPVDATRLAEGAPVVIPDTAVGNRVGRDRFRAVVEQAAENGIDRKTFYRIPPTQPPALAPARFADSKPGGARWGPSPGRSRQPHITLAPPEGAGYGRRNITVSRAPLGRKASRPRARRRGGAWNRRRGRGGFPRQRRHERGHPLPVRRGPVSRGLRTNREEWSSIRRPSGTVIAIAHRANGGAEPSEVAHGGAPAPDRSPATPHSARVPGGTGYGSGNITVSRAPPGNITRPSAGHRNRAGRTQHRHARRRNPAPDVLNRGGNHHRMARGGAPAPGRSPATPHSALAPGRDGLRLGESHRVTRATREHSAGSEPGEIDRRARFPAVPSPRSIPAAVTASPAGATDTSAPKPSAPRRYDGGECRPGGPGGNRTGVSRRW